MEKSEYGVRRIVEEFKEMKRVLMEELGYEPTDDVASRIYLAHKIHHLTYNKK